MRLALLQNQHTAGSSHFLDNLAEISLTYEAKVVLDLIPFIYDRPGRVARILDREDNAKTVMLNQPFTMNPQTKRPMAAMPTPQPPAAPQTGMGMPPQGPPMGMPRMPPAPPQRPQGKVLHYDLKKGRYGVVVSIGKSYKSRNEEGADEMGSLFEANPSLFPILGDIYLKFRDFPGHLEAAERVKKMLPPPLQAHDDGPDPQQMQQQLQQAGQMVEQLTKALDEKTKLLEMDGQKLQMQAQTAQGDQQAKLEIERMRNETQLAITEMKIRADEATAMLQAQVSREELTLTQRHQQEMAALQANHAQEQLAQTHVQDQQAAASDMLVHDDGILSATTAFGKTVVAAWLIAARKANTLVLVHRRQLLDQWRERLASFLDLPIKSIGQIGGGRRRPNGLIDVAVIQSLNRKQVVDDLVANYGHVVVDECHHLPAASFEQVERWFAIETACRRYLAQVRWPSGFVCPHCQARSATWTTSRGLWHCRACQGQTSVTAGTVFEARVCLEADPNNKLNPFKWSSSLGPPKATEAGLLPTAKPVRQPVMLKGLEKLKNSTPTSLAPGVARKLGAT
jgi:hypothetical protein